MANFRWPLRSTRGFSATPRRSWRRSAKVSAPAAKAIVRRAGPQDRSFYADSSLVSFGSPFVSLYVPGGAAGAPSQFDLLSPTIYQTEGSTQERCQISRLKVAVNMVAQPTGTGSQTYANRVVTIMIAKGRDEDLTEWISVQGANPRATQAQAVEYQDLTRSVRILARKTFLMDHYADSDTSTTTLYQQTAVAWGVRNRSTRIISVNRRKPFWVREPEFVRMYVHSYPFMIDGGAFSNVPAVSGHHQWYCTLKRY